LTKRLDPEVKAANKIKFGKMRSERMMGAGNHFYGKHHTEEANEKNRIAHIGKPSARKGKLHTQESKEKIRAARIGKTTSVRSNQLPTPIGNEKYIPLTKGLFAIVDDDDFDRINSVLWISHIDKNCVYAQRALPKKNGRQCAEKMHHAIIGKPPIGLMIDHINGNGLDNRKSNLRVVTNRENCQNKHFWKGSPILHSVSPEEASSKEK
jgi:hypothetical protein